MPSSLYVPLLEQTVFHPWLHVLYKWLSSSDANFDAISAWYMQFKARFPDILLRDATVQSQFTIALNMMVRR
jgi:tuftelin-interacting protein 11